ncbi:MAG: hypothetical protein WC119_01885 [Synergistaceae bacterium]
MKIYRIAEEDIKTIKWECPVTGIYIVAHFMDGSIMNGYDLFHYDKSYVDTFDNFYHARNWAKKHLDQNCKIPGLGVKVDNENI